jgi:hypothetical protein
MKYLSNYTEAAQTELFNETGAFFAFSTKQFNEAKKEGVTYVDLGAGLIAPKEQSKKLMDGLAEIQQKGIELDLKENGKKNIILRELGNYECFYSYDIDPCCDALEQYGITREEIATVFNENKHIDE